MDLQPRKYLLSDSHKIALQLGADNSLPRWIASDAMQKVSGALNELVQILLKCSRRSHDEKGLFVGERLTAPGSLQTSIGAIVN
jgi:hypothetical protein